MLHKVDEMAHARFSHVNLVSTSWWRWWWSSSLSSSSPPTPYYPWVKLVVAIVITFITITISTVPWKSKSDTSECSLPHTKRCRTAAASPAWRAAPRQGSSYRSSGCPSGPSCRCSPSLATQALRRPPLSPFPHSHSYLCWLWRGQKSWSLRIVNWDWQ